MTERMTVAEFKQVRRKKRKYNNVPKKVAGVGTMDSTGEARRYQDLQLLQKAGEIKGLEHHPTYELRVNGVLISTYEPDFVYFDVRAKARVVEDYKSPATKTPAYRMKKQLMKAIYNIDVLETGETDLC